MNQKNQYAQLTENNSLFIWEIFAHEKCAQFTEEDKENIYTAYDIATRAHAEQKRGDGRQYIEHIERTTRRFLEIHSSQYVNAEDIIVAILHDTIEDHPEYIREVRTKFPTTSIYTRLLAISKPSIKIITRVYTDFVEATIRNPNLFFTGYPGQVTSANYFLSTFSQKTLKDEEIEAQNRLFSHLSSLGISYKFQTLRDYQNYQFLWMIVLLTEIDFEIKVADRLDNLDDLAGVNLDYIEKNLISTRVYILKAEALERKDLIKFLENGIKKLEDRKIELSTQAVLPSAPVHRKSA